MALQVSQQNKSCLYFSQSHVEQGSFCTHGIGDMARFWKQAFSFGAKKTPPAPPHPDYLNDDSPMCDNRHHSAASGYVVDWIRSVPDEKSPDEKPTEPVLMLSTRNPKNTRYKHSPDPGPGPELPARNRSSSANSTSRLTAEWGTGEQGSIVNSDNSMDQTLSDSWERNGCCDSETVLMEEYSDPVDVRRPGNENADVDIFIVDDDYTEPYDMIKKHQPSPEGVNAEKLVLRYNSIYDPVAVVSDSNSQNIPETENMDNPRRDDFEEPSEWSDVKGKLMQIELGKVMKGKGQGLKKPTNHTGATAESPASANPPIAAPGKKSNNLSMTAKPRAAKRASLPHVSAGSKKDVDAVLPETTSSQDSLNGASEASNHGNHSQTQAEADDGQGTYEDPWDLQSKRLELESKFRFANQQQQVALEVQMRPKTGSVKEYKDKAMPAQKPVPRSRSVQAPPPDVVADSHKGKSSHHSPDTTDKQRSSSRTSQPLSPEVAAKNHRFRGGQTTPDKEDSPKHSQRSRLSHQLTQPPPDMLGDLHKNRNTQSSPDIGQKRKPRLHHHSSHEIIDSHPSPKSNLPTNSEPDNRPEDEYEDPWDKRAAELHREIARRHQSAPLPQELESKPPDEYEEPWDTRARSKVLSQLYSQDSLLTGSSSDGSNQSSPTSSQPPFPKKKLSLDIGQRSTNALGERVNPTVPLEKQGWYHGAITRNDAENLLRVHKEGSYLVRKSESSKQDFSLSLKSSQGFMHMKIVEVDGKLILGQFSQPFNSIPEMIHHYTLSKLPIKGAEHMSLQHPVINELL